MMREADRRLGLIKSVADRMGDKRQKGKVGHEAVTLLRQRVMALCAGWEDLNDAGELAHDPVHQLASGAEDARQCADFVALRERERPCERVGCEPGIGGAVYPIEAEGARVPDPGL